MFQDEMHFFDFTVEDLNALDLTFGDYSMNRANVNGIGFHNVGNFSIEMPFLASALSRLRIMPARVPWLSLPLTSAST